MMAFVLVFAAMTGTAVVLTRNPKQQVFAMGTNGLALSLLFMTLQAPDVAFAELIIGAAILPLMFFVVLASAKMDRRPQSESGVPETTEPVP